jgi:hypothetical protein
MEYGGNSGFSGTGSSKIEKNQFLVMIMWLEVLAAISRSVYLPYNSYTFSGLNCK